MAHEQELTVCIAGATGWTGRALVRGVLDAPDLSLRCAVSRSAAGRDLGEALGDEALGVPVYATVRGALDGVDVLIDYTSVTAVKDNTLAAIEPACPWSSAPLDSRRPTSTTSMRPPASVRSGSWLRGTSR